MTVQELKNKLNQMPDWMEVWIDNDNCSLNPKYQYQEIDTVDREAWKQDDRVIITIKEIE